jgi:hypothetical protein
VAPIARMLPEGRQMPAAFQDGLRDRTAREQWFARITGSFKEGAGHAAVRGTQNRCAVGILRALFEFWPPPTRRSCTRPARATTALPSDA